MTAPHAIRKPRAREVDIQESCRQLYQAVGCRVYWLSQFRKANQSPGLPDLWVAAPNARAAWWHEVKTPTGKRSEPQERFARECRAADVGYLVGGLEVAQQHLVTVGLARYDGPQLLLTPKRLVL